MAVDEQAVLRNVEVLVSDEASRDWISECAWGAGVGAGLAIVHIVCGRAGREAGPGRQSLSARSIKREGGTR